MKHQRMFLLAVVAAALSTVAGRAQITIPLTDRVSTTRGVNNGLNGFYWQRPVASILVDGNTNPLDSFSSQIDSFGAPTGTFVAHSLVYLGNDLTQVSGTFGSGPWLGSDAASFTGATTNNLDDGAFRFSGFLFVPAAGILNFGTTSDDGSRIKIGSVDILGGANDGSHGDLTTDVDVSFAGAGLYPFRVDYFNGDWTSDGGHNGSAVPGDHGGGILHIRQSGVDMTDTDLYRTVPEPSGVVLALAGLGATLAFRRRRR
jgi:hypothetical protein